MPRFTWIFSFCLSRDDSDAQSELDYENCKLASVPDEVFLHERTLERLYLSSNLNIAYFINKGILNCFLQLEDLPRPLFHCQGLRYLNLSDNDLQSIPPAIASLLALETLDVSKNCLAELPENIKGCKQLRVLNASLNPLCSLPDSVTQIASLEELYLNDTLLEYLPCEVGRMSRLRVLEVRDNHLAVLPKSLGRLPVLFRLDLGQNDFTEFPDVIGEMKNIRELWCDSNRLRKIPSVCQSKFSFLAVIGNCSHLQLFDVSENNLEELCWELSQCSALETLTLSRNDLESLPEIFGPMKNLKSLKLDENLLRSISSSVGGASGIEELHLAHNKLTSLPSSVGLLRKLHTLFLDDNQLQDLPFELGSCMNLRVLSVRGNQIGYVPAELGHLHRLRILTLTENKIKFLPCALSQLRELQALWLSSNQRKPLVPLVSANDEETGQKVLTCVLLPQISPAQDNGIEPPEQAATLRRRRSRAGNRSKERIDGSVVKFASTDPAPMAVVGLPNANDDQNAFCHLNRIPTPLPRDMKAWARNRVPPHPPPPDIVPTSSGSQVRPDIHAETKFSPPVYRRSKGRREMKLEGDGGVLPVGTSPCANTMAEGSQHHSRRFVPSRGYVHKESCHRIHEIPPPLFDSDDNEVDSTGSCKGE
ncbi:unnamed protein product [Notodromas monacha]|uniref:Disease resistance R13L4/SHOC-2-like LRR domain-containing protein n=1 Tax=Notodromas monacha TaxID=399045 RepID=A0A7R9GHM5_9CRUS|nr:unnamed protein product [Notodromas monacha]CAG0920958.1 unnamed protein product [Notodromas monacha]